MNIEFDLEILGWLLSDTTANLLAQNFGCKNVTHFTRHTFIDNGASVLAVAHLDTVRDMSQMWNGKLIGKQYKTYPTFDALKFATQITSVGLDDRLGLYFILYVLPQLGINVDVLLTSDEEIGQSSAQDFETTKEYNWMFQFDRHGYGNAVMYQYFTKELDAILSDIGYDVQQGTFSDISMLDHLGCSGINFGCGYINEHSDDCTTRTDWMQICISMFADFFDLYKDTKFVYNGYKKNTSKGVFIRSYIDDEEDAYCVDCGRKLLTREIQFGQCDICYDFYRTYVDEPMDDGKEEEIECNRCHISFADEDLDPYYGLCQDCYPKYIEENKL